MIININNIIFSRMRPHKKVDIVNNLTANELFMVSKDTVLRIIKEVGDSVSHSRDKRLYFSSNRRKGNNWNSDVTKIEYYKKKLYVNCYVQFSNTDTDTVEEFDKFFSSGEYNGSVERWDNYGNPRTYYFKYSVEEKAEVMRAILLEYLYTKYNTQLISKDDTEG